MNAQEHAALRTLAMQVVNVERVVLALEGQIRAFRADGWPAPAFAWSEERIPELRTVLGQLKRQLTAAAKGTVIGGWVAETKGLGPAVLLVLGQMPPLSEFASVGKVWRYVGLDPVDGRTRRRTAGQRLGFNGRLRAHALFRIGEPVVKVPGSVYRPVYDARKARTLEAHPPMLELGAGCPGCDAALQASAAQRAEREYSRERKAVARDCSHFGGIHWSDGHRHADALRVLAKAVLRDAWRVSNGMAPRGAEPAEQDPTSKAESPSSVPAAAL